VPTVIQVIRRRRVPTPDAAPVWPGTLVSIVTRRLYKETILLGLGGEGDVTFCRRVRNKMFLHEPRSSLLTLHKPSVIRGGRTTNTNPLL